VLVWVPATVARAENLLNPSFEGINTKVLFSVVDFCLQMSGFLNFCIFMCVAPRPYRCVVAFL